MKMRLFTRHGVTLMLGDAEGTTTCAEFQRLLSKGLVCVEPAEQPPAGADSLYTHEEPLLSIPDKRDIRHREDAMSTKRSTPKQPAATGP